MLTLHKARNILKKWLEEIITNIVRHVIALNTSKFVMIDPISIKILMITGNEDNKIKSKYNSICLAILTAMVPNIYLN